jgi:hypothetical protein
MRINELLVESQQLDEGPFTQAIGKVGGKIAKGVANVGKDLKTGFKAGYSGEQPPADATATAEPAASAPVKKAAPTQAAPVQKAAGGGIIDKIKQGFKQGQGAPAAEPAATSTPAAATTAPAAPAANPEAEKQSKIGVGQINKIIPTLRTRDLMSLKKNLDTVIAKKSSEKPAAATAAPATDATKAAPASSAAPDANAPVPVGSSFTYGSVDGQPEAWTKTAKGWQSSIGGSIAAGSYGKSIEQAYKQSQKNKAPSQAEIDSERDRLMGVTSDSIIRKGPVMAESFSLYRKH